MTKKAGRCGVGGSGGSGGKKHSPGDTGELGLDLDRELRTLEGRDS